MLTFPHTLLLHTFFLKKIVKSISFSGYIASSLTYPFTVVSHCNIVSRSGLAAGYPPNMPLHYNNWFDIWKQLSRDNQLKRGSSLLFRKYTGPQVVIGNRAIPLDPRMKSEMKLN